MKISVIKNDGEFVDFLLHGDEMSLTLVGVDCVEASVSNDDHVVSFYFHQGIRYVGYLDIKGLSEGLAVVEMIHAEGIFQMSCSMETRLSRV